MWRHFQTLRFKLAALYLVVFGVILAALCMIILTLREAGLRADFDDRLRVRAEAMIERIQVSAEATRPGWAAKSPLPRLIPFTFPGYFFQLRLSDGVVLERSRNLGAVELPLSTKARASRESKVPMFEDLPAEFAYQLLGSAGEVRLLTLYRDTDETEPFYLQVALNLRSVNSLIKELRTLMLLLVPSGLFAAAMASWFVAGKSLSPISKVAEVAARLDTQNLSLRFDHPRGKDEIASLVATVNSMLDRIEEGFESQGRFIASVSHELKTPLAILLSNVQVLMQKDRSPEEYARFAANVQDEVRVMARIVDSLLILARAEAGMPYTSPEEVSLNEVVVDAVERCQPLASQQEVRQVPTIVAPQNGSPEPIVLGDGELLRLAFTNLLRNAIRHSPPEASVEIIVTRNESEARVTVRDHGPGIPPEHIGRVFDQFYRVPNPKHSFEGVGLGLTITRGTIRLHGGTIAVSNHSQGGCQFVVRLPLLRRDDTDAD